MECIRDSFVFYESFFDAIYDLPDDERLKCYDMLCQYALCGVEPNVDGTARALFKLMKAQIDANIRRRENGSKGGRPVNQSGTKSEPETNQKETKEEPNHNLTKTKEKPNQNLTETKPEPNVNANANANANANNRVSNETLVEIVDDFNRICASYPKVTKLTDIRKKHLKERLRTHTADELRTAFWKIEQSEFARSGTWCGFDWIVKSENNLVKVLEGNYDDKQPVDKYEIARQKIHDAIYGGTS